MKKTFIILLLVAMTAIPVFATRISVTYQDTDYILNTTKKITTENVAYFNGMYDAFVCVKEGMQLYEMQQVIASKNFVDEKNAVSTAQKAEYEEAFLDFMNNYTYGTAGEFKDVYPLYAALMTMPVSYKNSRLILEFGGARFFLKNL
jgi:hypothetical protein